MLGFPTCSKLPNQSSSALDYLSTRVDDTCGIISIVEDRFCDIFCRLNRAPVFYVSELNGTLEKL